MNMAGSEWLDGEIPTSLKVLTLNDLVNPVFICLPFGFITKREASIADSTSDWILGTRGGTQKSCREVYLATFQRTLTTIWFDVELQLASY